MTPEDREKLDKYTWNDLKRENKVIRMAIDRFVPPRNNMDDPCCTVCGFSPDAFERIVERELSERERLAVERFAGKVQLYDHIDVPIEENGKERYFIIGKQFNDHMDRVFATMFPAAADEPTNLSEGE